MGIVRRCGRPPQPGPQIHKSTRERMQLLGHPAALGNAAGETAAHGEREVASDDIICGCPRHHR